MVKGLSITEAGTKAYQRTRDYLGMACKGGTPVAYHLIDSIILLAGLCQAALRPQVLEP